MKQVFILLIALLFLQRATAQKTGEVATVVSDSINHVRMTNASIVITRAADSIIIASGRTDGSGRCVLFVRDTGMYILNIFYPGYTDYAGKIMVSHIQGPNPYRISLIPIAHLLDEVIVKNEILKIRLRGDTIEYRADSFMTDRNASVEELLKKLPGISVDGNGNINAYGRRVQKIMIGGEEYFSEDPTLVTRSLRSNMIQKVQVFDQKSDQSVFSKINDGKSVKAINLELKPDKKKGYFGKLEGGASFGNFYNNLLMVNRFNGDQKVAVFFVQSNLGTTGLSWQDTRTYSDFSLTEQESSGFTTSKTSRLENWDGTYQNQGIPFVTSFGSHYSDKLNNLVSLNGNYRYYAINLDVKSVTDQQFNLDNEIYLRHQNSTLHNQALSNRGIVKTTIKFSKNEDLIIGFDINTGRKNISNHVASVMYLDTIQKLNAQNRSLQVEGSENNFGASMLWRKKFISGSTLSISGKIFSNRNVFNGYLRSEDSLFQNNLLSKDSITDQFKKDSFDNLTYNSKAVISFPLNVFSTVLFSANWTLSSSNNTVGTFNKNVSGHYVIEDPIYSGMYGLGGQNTNLGAGYNFSKGKVIINIMADGGFSTLIQRTPNQSNFSKSFFTFFPTATFTYRFSQQHNLILDYTGTTMLPQIQQLQPVLTNLDPLSQMSGNPNLSKAFRHSITIQYYHFKSAEDISFSAGGVVSFDHNGFSSDEHLDPFGKSSYRYVNLSGNNRMSFFSYYTCKPFHKLFDLSVSATANGTSYSKILNDQRIKTQSFDYGISLSPSYYRQDKFSFEFRSSFHWNHIFSYVPELRQQHYTNLVLQPSISINLFKYTVMASDLYYSKYPVSNIYGQSTDISMLNISLSQQILKDRSVTIKFSVKDLLNTNTGLSRSVSENYISQTEFNTISRYFMLSAIYHFSHTLKTK